MINARDPRQDATALLPPGSIGLVLEPSPPANVDPAWFADDPTEPPKADEVVTPIPGEGRTWAELAGLDAEIAQFAASHWLDGSRRLEPLPPHFGEVRDALHQLAFFAVAPRRFAATGKLGLRYTHRGFGTPFFRGVDGAHEQVRVEGDTLVIQEGGGLVTETISTIGSACRILGLDYRERWFEGFHDPPEPVGPDHPLRVDPSVTASIGDWFGFASHVLECARRTPDAADVTRVQLWPEHFDLAFEMGSADRGQRAGYGASPGDAAHLAPYLYVVAWEPVDRSDPYWNDLTINGASLPHGTLLAAEDPYGMALRFLRGGFDRLTSAVPLAGR